MITWLTRNKFHNLRCHVYTIYSDCTRI